MNEDNAPIVVVATYAEDEIHHEDTGRITRIVGGPAKWMSETLQGRGVPFTLLTGEERARVRIQVHEGEEHGEMNSVTPITQPLPEYAPLYLISTVADEFPLARLTGVRGVVGIDLQGYIRARGREERLRLPEEIATRLDIIKVTEEECAQLHPKLFQELQNHILLVTKGAKGFELYERETHKTYTITPIDAPDAIGAGDVFFTAFCMTYLETKNTEQAAQQAVQQVTQFLIDKET